MGLVAASALSIAKFDTPHITGSVVLPPVSEQGGTIKTDSDGFITSLPAAVYTDDQRKQLEKLKDQYVRIAKDSYPLIIKTLHLEDKPASTKNVRIELTYQYGGVAATSGGGFGGLDPQGPTIQVSAKYALAHPNDLGMIVHEMVHVVQAYPKYDPVWLVEGVADYVRWFFFEPVEKRPSPRLPNADARASYQTTAAFLFWATNKYDKDLVVKINTAEQAGTYTDELFKSSTGKTLDELNTKWKETLPPPNPPALRG